MISRRKIFASLGALPLVGLPFRAGASAHLVSDSDLIAAANILQPGLREYKNSDITMMIFVTPDPRGLMVIGSLETGSIFGGRHLAFAITERSIADNSYKAQFNPCLLRLAELLRDPTLAREFAAKGVEMCDEVAATPGITDGLS